MTLWACRITRPLTEAEEAHLTALLPPERRARLARTRSEARRREALCAYAALLCALRERFGWRALPEVTRSAAGKPGFADYPDVHFSLSHTAGAVLVGVDCRPIGVDIEAIRPMRRAAMVALTGEETEEAFFRCWVRREARVKRTGTGASLRRELPETAGERCCYVETFPGFAACAALTGGAGEPEVRRLDVDALLARLG